MKILYIFPLHDEVNLATTEFYAIYQNMTEYIFFQQIINFELAE